MWKDIPAENKKRFNIIVFIVLPIISIASFIIGTKIAKLLFNIQVDLKGILFVSFLFLITYIRCVMAVYRKLKKKHRGSKTNGVTH